jgi:general secretion pathway protein J
VTRARSNSEDGYALLEAIATLLIASLAFLMIATAAAILAQSTERTAAETNIGEVLIAGTSAWRREVLAAIDPAALGVADEDGASFRGSAGAIRFVAAPGGLDGISETVAIRSQGGRLWRESGAFGASPGVRGPAVLLEGPWTYRFEFAGGDEPEWQPAWQDAESLPKAVRLTVSGRDGQIALVAVRLMTDPHTDCASDDLSCAEEGGEEEGDDAAR